MKQNVVGFWGDWERKHLQTLSTTMPEQGGGERKNKYGNSKAINYWDKARWCGGASEERDAC